MVDLVRLDTIARTDTRQIGGGPPTVYRRIIGDGVAGSNHLDRAGLGAR
ncbi:hypothetical protein BAL199_11067 [alpha proteobacterium BAL199]|nr:hypothetical protein BAL199_11067 [alpha proteobacterium BAL199]